MFAFSIVIALLKKVSLSLWFESPESPARGQQLKHMVSWVCIIFQDAACPLKTASVVEVLQGGERVANDFLGSFDDPLKCLPVCAVVQLANHKEIQ